MASNNRSDALPEPRLQILSRDPDKVYCDICDKNWSKKNNKQRRQKVLKNKRWNGKFVNTSLTRFTTRSTGPGRISHNVWSCGLEQLVLIESLAYLSPGISYVELVYNTALYDTQHQQQIKTLLLILIVSFLLHPCILCYVSSEFWKTVQEFFLQCESYSNHLHLGV